MPKKTTFEKIDENKFEFESSVTITSNSTCYIRSPINLGRNLQNRKLKITIEVLED